MADKVEKQELEVGAGGAEGTKKEYVPYIPGTKEEQNEEKINIEAEYDKTNQEANVVGSQEPQKKKVVEKKTSTLSSDIKEAINQLNRPDAQKGIEQAYTNMENTIKNSKNEKGIAGFIGKIINRINP